MALIDMEKAYYKVNKNENLTAHQRIFETVISVPIKKNLHS